MRPGRALSIAAAFLALSFAVAAAEKADPRRPAKSQSVRPAAKPIKPVPAIRATPQVRPPARATGVPAPGAAAPVSRPPVATRPLPTPGAAAPVNRPPVATRP